MSQNESSDCAIEEIIASVFAGEADTIEGPEYFTGKNWKYPASLRGWTAVGILGDSCALRTITKHGIGPRVASRSAALLPPITVGDTSTAREV